MTEQQKIKAWAIELRHTLILAQIMEHFGKSLAAHQFTPPEFKKFTKEMAYGARVMINNYNLLKAYMRKTGRIDDFQLISNELNASKILDVAELIDFIVQFENIDDITETLKKELTQFLPHGQSAITAPLHVCGDEA